MLKTLGVGTTFGSSDLEKVHAVVARSTFGSQNVKNTRGSDHFWKFRSRKRARRSRVRTTVGGARDCDLVKLCRVRGSSH